MLLITRDDLLDAIAKCQGQKNPNANTCIKLAAYYTILDHTPESKYDYSYSDGTVSEFWELIRTKNTDAVIDIMDSLMEELQSVNPKIYYATMERIKEL